MKIFNVGKAFSRQQEQDEKSDNLHTEAEGYELASDGGFIELLKGALFLLFAYYNVRLFVVTVHGWEGYLDSPLCLIRRSDGLLLPAELHAQCRRA